MESFAFASMKKSFCVRRPGGDARDACHVKRVEKVDLAQMIHWNLIISTANSRAERQNMSVSIQKWFLIARDEDDGWGVRDGRQRCTMTIMPARGGKARGAGYAARDFLRMKRNENFHSILHSNVDWHFSLSLLLSFSLSLFRFTYARRTHAHAMVFTIRCRNTDSMNIIMFKSKWICWAFRQLKIYFYMFDEHAPRQQHCEREFWADEARVNCLVFHISYERIDGEVNALENE